MKVWKQQHELIYYCFKNREHLSMQETDFTGICSFTHVLYLYLVGTVSICQNLA